MSHSGRAASTSLSFARAPFNVFIVYRQNEGKYHVRWPKSILRNMRSLSVAAVVIALSAGNVRCSASEGDSFQDDKFTPSRELSGSTCSRDDAFDPLNPRRRSTLAFITRRNAAQRERDGASRVCQINSGDTDTASKYHKTLPHDELGQVDPAAFEALEQCVKSGDLDTCEAVPSGEPSGSLVNPIAGFTINLAGPASTSVTTPPVPTLDSPELAAQLAEVYWMALARDVPFSQYGLDDVTTTAAANLAAMPGFSGGFGVSQGIDGSVDPVSQLFRTNFTGVEAGPMISQLLIKDFTLDSITVTPQQNSFAANIDYMTSYDEWLNIQNGGEPNGTEEIDETPRFIRNARDLATTAATDIIFTEAFRGALVLIAEGAINRGGSNGPYMESTRQEGFVNYGLSHVMRDLGRMELSQHSSWYQKWQVHLFVRPEALAGTVHNTILGALNAPIDPSLLENEELLDRVAASNAAQNADGSAPYLLSQAVVDGSPAHPAYPSGHAVQNGAFATMLKAIVGLERGTDCIPNPVFPDDDGLTLLEYTGDCLTFEGEINKLASNVAIGRMMMGVHYRFDATEGMRLGETVAVRILHQEAIAFPEQYPYTFNLFTGEEIALFPDGTFSIDGVECRGDIYTGVEDCFD